MASYDGPLPIGFGQTISQPSLVVELVGEYGWKGHHPTILYQLPQSIEEGHPMFIFKNIA